MKNEKRYIIIYWFLYFLLISLIEAGPLHFYFESFSSNLITLPLKIVFALIVTEWMMPAFLLKKQTITFLVLYFLLLALSGVIMRLADNYLVLAYILTHWKSEPVLSTPPLLYAIIKLQFALAIPMAIKLFLHWIETQNRSIEITNQKMQAELNFLRSQLHPHFMFNALNSLYSKVLTKSEEAPAMVLKISSLLRFSVYDANTKSISLAKEVEYLENYIDLQRIRFQDSVDISFIVHGNLNEKTIEPFLIMPFIENGFKYCQGSEDSAAWVTIQLTVDGDWLTLTVDNSKGKANGLVQNEGLVSGGIGQANVRTRLNLLYHDKYTLKFEDGEDNYFVYLKLKIS